ncbi:MAG: HlyD family efflux transporter periplasmic adaptor subunit [Luteitalea sp.]|nr:HlyD family efflux transporter periplasmic adaptor subunit [Luteitalea sp.]
MMPVAVAARRRPPIARRQRALVVLATVLVVGGAWGCRAADPRVQAETPSGEERPEADVAVAATARVEGATETIEVGAGVDGVIAELRVREGDVVHRGEVLAVIDRRELHAELSLAAAAADAARQARTRVLRGSRTEEREQAEAEVAAAEAVVRQTEAQYRRTAELFAEGILAPAERDEVRRNLEVSKAQLQAARKRTELIKAPPLPEDVAKADADVRSAEERIRLVQQTLDKSVVRAPIDGTVLRTMLRAGETFSVMVPRAILSLADTSRLRVRAEVDERDVGQVYAGQPVLVRGDVWHGRGVPGRVGRVGAQMGRKSVRTGDPAEKGDRDVLEVLVDLEHEDPRLVVGLRVTALFLKGTMPASNHPVPVR